MAISLSSAPVIIPSKLPLLLQSQNCFAAPHFQISLRKTPNFIPRVSSKSTNLSLSSIITDLQEGSRDSTAQQQHNDNKIADRWKEIHGQNNWSGLLDPMDPLLRSELMKYGEMTQATYDGFFYDQYSQYCGSCRFMPQDFFHGLGLAKNGYHVSRYLFATSNMKLPKFFRKSFFPTKWSKSANWIGYVAVSEDETTVRLGRRDILIAWRGTVTGLEWIEDLMTSQKPLQDYKIPSPDPNIRAESGFLDLYTDKDTSCQYCAFSAREQILSEIKKLIEKYNNEEISITITGHSLGGALAILSALDIAETRLHETDDRKRANVCVFTFACPRVGNLRFKERIEELGVKVLRVVNVHDVVPKSPGFLLNENLPAGVLKVVEGWLKFYTHVGVELEVDHSNSPYLKEVANPANAHNLEVHLHLLDGYLGKGKKFESVSGRDIALVNKSSDFLKDELLVPPSWKQDENKGMIFKNGRWVQPERPKLDDHHADTHRHLKRLGLN